MNDARRPDPIRIQNACPKKWGELVGGDAGEERRGDAAAAVDRTPGLVDGDDDRELRVVGGHDAHEPGDVAML